MLEPPVHPMPKPDATLFIVPGCTHCPTVLDGLVRLLKQGSLGRLEVIDATQHPELAERNGVRSAPWTRIGAFEIIGGQHYDDLKIWAEAAADGLGISRYYSHLLETRRLEAVVEHLRRTPANLPDLVLLLESLETPMAVRIGVGAVIEELADEGLLAVMLPELEALTRSAEPQVRADACHYLSLGRDPRYIPAIRTLLDDPDPEVRGIAGESLAILETETASAT